MKIALVHDYIKEYGGAERVLEAFHELFPDAPIFTTVYCPQFLGPHQQRFSTWDIRPSWLQHIPWKEKLISPLRLLAPSVFAQMDFSEFDIVVVSATGAYQSNMIHKGTATQLCYCHTPPRYLYGYATARNWKKNPLMRIMGELGNAALRNVDKRASSHVDQFIANSKEVAGRIQRFYQKPSVIIYPPIKLPETPKRQQGRGDYFITGGRLAQAKHIDLAIRACSELQLPLKVFGKSFAGYETVLRQYAGPSVEFLGEISDQEKWHYLAHAKAFIFPSEDEDFGILPVEAMAVGTPVIAHKSGGVQETVIEGKTGLFFPVLSVQSLEDTLISFQKLPDTWVMACKKQAAGFTEGRFQKEISELINQTMEKRTKHTV